MSQTRMGWGENKGKEPRSMSIKVGEVVMLWSSVGRPSVGDGRDTKGGEERGKQR